MMLAFSIGDIVKVPFGYLLDILYDFTNYGLALILFAVIVKLVLLPATAKGKKSSMKMSRLTPRIEAIKAKYPNDQQKQSQEIQALYKSEGISMGGGCLWSVVPILILIPLYAVVRQPLIYMMHESKEVAEIIVATIKEAAPDMFGKNEFYAQMTAAALIPEHLEAIGAALAEKGLPALKEATAKGIDFHFLGIDLAAIPQWQFWKWNINETHSLWHYIGGALLPIVSAGSQLLSMFINQRVNNSLSTNDKGIEDKETQKNAQTNQSMKMMMWISPLMSLWIGFGMPAALSLYWIVQGVVTTVSDIYLTKKYRKIYDAEDAERLKKHLAEEALEAEKERIRAERRAANPEGITANTSKKKLQQAKQEAKEAQKAAAAHEYAVSKGLAAAEAPSKEKEALSGITDRPFCKGRAYDPNRYKNTEE